MTDEQTQKDHEPAKAASLNTFSSVLSALVGKVVTVANSESYEDAPIGHRLGAGFYDAKVLEVRTDFVILATQFHHARGQGDDEAVSQYIPLSRVKRVSVMKSEKILHI
ncbi:MAG: hypothetical protein ACPG31_05875 [Planctomycetota bacterium]